MKDFNYDKFETYMMVALTSLVSLAISTMLVIHLFSGVGAPSLLWECIVVMGTIYLSKIAFAEFKNLKK